MMKSKLSLRNLARCVLLLKFLLLFLFLATGCNLSTSPSSSIEDIPTAIKNTCRSDYKVDVMVRQVGSTIWIYLPVENIFAPLEKNQKPEKYFERYTVEDNKSDFIGGILKCDYIIKPLPEKEKLQEFSFNKEAFKKKLHVWMAINRVLMSSDYKKKNPPQFYGIILADIKNGFAIRDLFYYQDIKKVFYSYISSTEFQHRTVEDTLLSLDIIGDKEGVHQDYKNTTMKDFLSMQIQGRIRLKFQRPEVEKNADIDKEVQKIIAYVLQIYDFNDFSGVEINNLVTGKRMVLNKAAILSKTTEL